MCKSAIELHKCPTCGAECEIGESGTQVAFATGEVITQFYKPVGIVIICSVCGEAVNKFEGLLQCKCGLWYLAGPTEMM